MKKLLGILGALTLAPSSAIGIVNSMCSYTNQLSSDEISMSIKEMKDTMDSKSDLDDYITVYRKVPNVIYYAETREDLDNYMSVVFAFRNKIDRIDKNAFQEKEIYSLNQEIQRRYSNWISDEDVNVSLDKYYLAKKQLKLISKKMYYSFNETSAEMMMKDMDTYQPLREEQSRLEAEKTSLIKEISYNKSIIQQYGRMLEWQGRLNKIYDNWIFKATSLKDQFYNSLKNIGNLGSIENLANYFKDRNEQYLKKVVRDFFKGESEDSIDATYQEVVEQIKNRTVDIDNAKPADWIQKDDNGQGDKDYNNQFTNKELIEKSEEVIKQKIKDEKVERSKKIKAISDVCSEIYKLDDIIFGNLHAAAKNFTDFVSSGIGQLSSDLKSAFEENGIHVTTKLDEAVEEAMKIAKSIAQSIISTFGTDDIKNISSIVFGAVDMIKNWLNTMDVMKNSGKIINIIKSTQKEVTAIPDDCNVDVAKKNKEIENEENRCAWIEQRLKVIDEELKKSDFINVKKTSENWENSFSDFKDFLGIKVLNNSLMLGVPFNGGDFNLDIIKYFKNNYIDFCNSAGEENMLFNRILNSGKAKKILQDDYENFINDHKKFELIRAIVEKGYEELK